MEGRAGDFHIHASTRAVIWLNTLTWAPPASIRSITMFVPDEGRAVLPGLSGMREQLITELENISSSQNAARWARRVMGMG
jgi:hypothetical protein